MNNQSEKNIRRSESETVKNQSQKNIQRSESETMDERLASLNITTKRIPMNPPKTQEEFIQGVITFWRELKEKDRQDDYRTAVDQFLGEIIRKSEYLKNSYNAIISLKADLREEKARSSEQRSSLLIADIDAVPWDRARALLEAESIYGKNSMKMLKKKSSDYKIQLTQAIEAIVDAKNSLSSLKQTMKNWEAAIELKQEKLDNDESKKLHNLEVDKKVNQLKRQKISRRVKQNSVIEIEDDEEELSKKKDEVSTSVNDQNQSNVISTVVSTNRNQTADVEMDDSVSDISFLFLSPEELDKKMKEVLKFK